ncbi:hypothetical protein [Mucilaginibacter sp. KACC 22063]|uniref:hypothetical protein n=1 Tax=Mucilaginibacter sp. KACC 22063 TaxID=3025666 RepID=UPI002366AC83|nr:hypothetical protein [Mucilaginibacter sp. KACC 22063]WDF55166.1 hypothetical protein PQ461_19735 [Mucilaginibacter sp. KACC 22063]
MKITSGKSFKKLTGIQKLLLKISDKKKYKKYKEYLGEYARLVPMMNFASSGETLNRERIAEIVKIKDHLNIVHSGNAGDIIYALPTLKAIAENFATTIDLYLKLNQPMEYINNTHPLGGVMMNQKMAELLIPLIEAQPYIRHCKVLKDEIIDIDLDNVRRAGLRQDRGSIARWYGYITGITPNLYQPWLTIKPNSAYANTLVIARSQRYLSEFIDYTFLNNYPNKIFVGIKPEWDEIKKMLPGIQWVQVNNFLELAEIIAGCKLFIGNQSFPFSIAEGLKVPRLLETFLEVPNVVPEGPGAYDFYFQDHLESQVKFLMQ